MIDHFAAPWVANDRYQLRDDARRFETWENSYALRAGLGAAVAYSTALGLEVIQNRVWRLAATCRGMLSELPGAKIRDIGKLQCAIVSFTIDGLDPRETVAALRRQGIAIDASEPASTRLDAEARDLPVVMRMAPHYYNIEQDLKQFIHALRGLL